MPLHHQALALLAAAIWGSNFVLIKQGLEELPPLLFVGLRFLIVALPLVFFLPRPRVPPWMLISYGLLIGCGQFGLLFWIMQSHITPGLASLVIQMQVFFTILLASMMYGERVKTLQWLALAISFAGLALVAAHTDHDTTVFGLCIVLLAALSWAGGNLVIKRAGRVSIVAFLAWSSLAPAPVLLGLALWHYGVEINLQALQNLSLSTGLILLWQSVGNTLIGYGAWNWLLDRYPAATVTPWALLVPVFGMGTSWLVLGEMLPWWKLLSAALILSGLVINTWAMRRRLRH